MFGFALFMMIVVIGSLGLIAGLRLLGVVGSAPDSPPVISREELERLHDALAVVDARLDRLEDQQTFLEGLIAERSHPSALPPGPNDKTP